MLGKKDEDGKRHGDGPLLNGLYFDTWYDLSNTSSDNLGYIFYQNKLLGMPRIMQVRVRNQSCRLSSQAKQMVGACIAQYSDSVMDTEPFGYGLTAPSTDPTYSA